MCCLGARRYEPAKRPACQVILKSLFGAIVSGYLSLCNCLLKRQVAILKNNKKTLKLK